MPDSILDHVAIRVPDRESATEELLTRLDVQVIEQTDRHTVIGADRDYGKLTLLDAEDRAVPTSQRIVSLVLAAGVDGPAAPLKLQDGLIVTFAAPRGGESSATDVPRHALIGLSVRVGDPPLAAAAFEVMDGFRVNVVGRDVAVVDVGDSTAGTITLLRERWERDENPLLDHIGIRVADAERWRIRAEELGVDVLGRVDAPHSRAVFVTGPDGLLLGFVELTAALQQA